MNASTLQALYVKGHCIQLLMLHCSKLYGENYCCCGRVEMDHPPTDQVDSRGQVMPWSFEYDVKAVTTRCFGTIMFKGFAKSKMAYSPVSLVKSRNDLAEKPPLKLKVSKTS